MPVILFHAGATMFSGGFVGVDVFFVISGFLITSILISDLETGRFSILNFYERRVRRILPALFVVMAACIPFAWVMMLPDQMIEFGRALVAVPLFLSNVLFWRESNYFAPTAEEKPLLHTWSLAVEEQYYLFFPILLFVIWRWGPRVTLAIILAVGLLSLAVAEWGWRNEPTANFYLAPSRLWEMFAGSACAMIMWRRTVAPNPFLATTGLVMIVGCVVLYDATVPFPSVYTLVPVAGAALVILFATTDRSAGRLLNTPALVGIGLISYSAYLWHQPLFAFARVQSSGSPATATMVILTALTFALAWLTWRFVERPFRAGPARWPADRSSLFGLAAIGTVGFIVAGLGLTMQGGWNSRMPETYFRASTDLAAAAQARGQAIRSGVCQYNGLGQGANIADFVRDWECMPPASASAAERGTAIYGDSHAADKAMALRLNGFDLMQVGGAACPMLPGPGYCGRLLQMFHDRAAEAEITTVLVGNSFSSDELRPETLQLVVDHWASRYDRVYLFAPTPAFHGFASRFLRDGIEGVATMEADLSTAERFAQSIGRVTIPPNLSILDTAAALCADTVPCRPVAQGEILVVDNFHLSVAGAQRAGAGFVAELRAQGESDVAQ